MSGMDFKPRIAQLWPWVAAGAVLILLTWVMVRVGVWFEDDRLWRIYGLTAAYGLAGAALLGMVWRVASYELRVARRTLPQRFGNALACRLIRWLHGVRFTDLGPFRAIRFDALRSLAMDDAGYGWTVQMQVRAARLGLRSAEAPVSYRRRIGRSKISGTVRGVVSAGGKILYTIFREGFNTKPRQPAPAQPATSDK